MFECLNHLIIDHCFMSRMNITLCWRWSMSTRRCSRQSMIIWVLWCCQQLLSVVIRWWLFVSCIHNLWIPSKRMAVSSTLSDFYRTRIWWECMHMCLNTEYIHKYMIIYHTVFCHPILELLFFLYKYIVHANSTRHEYYCVVWWLGQWHAYTTIGTSFGLWEGKITCKSTAQVTC